MPEKTEEYFKNGVANLGDVGYVNEKGEYYIDGRISDFIPVAENIRLYPYEIEDVVEDILERNQRYDAIIKDYCVHGLPRGEFEIPALQLYVDGENSDVAQEMIEEIREALETKVIRSKRVAAYKIRTVAFPVTFAGKMDVKSLKNETDGFITTF
jgi:acyl-CoA synthetase (AMP-forming)/AMP-acid ligase II